MMRRNVVFGRKLNLTFLLAVTCCTGSLAQPTSPQNSPISRVAGAIKRIQPDVILLTTDTGNEIAAQLVGATRILRVEPGQKDLKNAATITVQDLQPGDRVLVRGQSSPDGKSIAALAVIVMKQADVNAKREHDRLNWQKGVDGLVVSVDPATGTIIVTSAGLGPAKKLAIHTTKATILRRYVPGSIKFDDAKPASIDQIRPGDQLRARGVRGQNGEEFTAEEIVAGSFRNIAGRILSIDVPGNSITVSDVVRKKTVVLKTTSDSQLKNLPAEMAQRIAMHLKVATGPASEPGSAADGQARAGQGSAISGERGSAKANDGVPTLDRMLARLPNASLGELHKGDAVVILTQAEDLNPVVIKLVAGVEPILTASPNQGATSILSPWTLGGGGAEGDAAP